MFFSRQVLILAAACLLLSSFATPAAAQSVASGTIEGTVVDPTGAVVTGATVEVRNPISRYQQTTTTDSMGAFRFTNLPLNPYHVEVIAPGFAAAAQDVGGPVCSCRRGYCYICKAPNAFAGIRIERHDRHDRSGCRHRFQWILPSVR